jgi:tetratricopeptide (TPR) repeat protein
MGTITKYYPFIDEESKSLLDSVMDSSSSYYEFVQQLSEVVLHNEVPVSIAFLAAIHAWWCRLEESMGLIQEKYKGVPCIRPLGYIMTSFEKHQKMYHDSVVEAIERALEPTLEDWIEIELHLLHAFFHWGPVSDVPSFLEPIEKAKCLIDANPNLKCFESLIYAFEGKAKSKEGNVKISLPVLRKGQELAELYDDSLFLYICLLTQGSLLKGINIRDSIARFEEAYDLVQDLGVPFLIAEVLNDSANAFEAAGEFDLAISSHQEELKVLGEEGYPHPILARIYATLGDGHRAFDQINGYCEQMGHDVIAPFHLLRTWALALINRLEEADSELATAHSLIFNYGRERALGSYYHVSGVVEYRKGNLSAALHYLEKAHEIAERNPLGTNQNHALLDIVRVEITQSSQSADGAEVIGPGKWLCTLENYAMDRDLPGIRMYAALLKSDFYQKHGQIKDAIGALEDALGITDSLGVRTLREMITGRITELNQLLKQA